MGLQCAIALKFNIAVTSWWARWRLKSPASRLFIQPFIQAQIKEKRKHQSSAPLSFVRGIHRWPVNSPHKGPVTRKRFPFDDVIMNKCLSGTVSKAAELLLQPFTSPSAKILLIVSGRGAFYESNTFRRLVWECHFTSGGNISACQSKLRMWDIGLTTFLGFILFSIPFCRFENDR